jgi:hypothetical protein
MVLRASWVVPGLIVLSAFAIAPMAAQAAAHPAGHGTPEWIWITLAAAAAALILLALSIWRLARRLSDLGAPPI